MTDEDNITRAEMELKLIKAITASEKRIIDTIGGMPYELKTLQREVSAFMETHKEDIEEISKAVKANADNIVINSKAIITAEAETVSTNRRWRILTALGATLAGFFGGQID